MEECQKKQRTEFNNNFFAESQLLAVSPFLELGKTFTDPETEFNLKQFSKSVQAEKR